MGLETQPRLYSRRNFLKITTAATLALPLAYVGCSPSAQQREFDNYKTSLSLNSHAIDGVTSQVDRQVDQLYAWITDQTKQDPKFSHRLVEPLDVYKANKTNPDRNFYSFLLDDATKRGVVAMSTPPNSTEMPDERYFRMGFIEPGLGGATDAGSYIYGLQLLVINRTMNTSSVLDSLVIYHELVHKRQDMNFRRRFMESGQMEAYLDFFRSKPGEKNKILPGTEYEAYAQEAIVLDLLTGGKLQTDSQANSINLESYIDVLKLTKADDIELFKYMLEIGKFFFRSGSSLDHYQPEYKQYVNDALRHYDFYSVDDQGKFARIK